MSPAFNFSIPFLEQFGENRLTIWEISKQKANPVSLKNLHTSQNKI